ncbi:MAG: hypothetical protein GXP62_19300 [Oligoflexia bacterium]|nr:hypothetical protein [Oligoflexia bacterium]
MKHQQAQQMRVEGSQRGGQGIVWCACRSGAAAQPFPRSGHNGITAGKRPDDRVPICAPYPQPARTDGRQPNGHHDAQQQAKNCGL